MKNIFKVGLVLGLLVGNSFWMSRVNAQSYYWDVNNGTWDSGTSVSWSPNTTGGNDTALTTGTGNNLYFSSSTISGPVAVNVAGVQASGTLFLNQAGGLAFSGGTISALGYVVNVSTTFNSYMSSINSSNMFFNTAGQTLTFNGGGVFSGNSTSTNAATSTIILNSGSYSYVNNTWGFNWGSPSAGTGGVFINSGATVYMQGLAWFAIYGNSLVTVNGGFVNNPNGGIWLGRGGSARLIINSGTVSDSNAAGVAVIGANSGTSAILEVHDTGVLQTNYLNVGGQGTTNGIALFTTDGGTSNIGTLVTGSAWQASTSGTSIINISGSAVVNIGSGGITNVGSGSFAYNIILSGGTIGVLNGVSQWSSSMNMTLSKGSNGNVTFSAYDSDYNARQITLSGVLSGTGGLNVSGGTLLLQGVNIYTGNTVVNSTLDTPGLLQLANGAQLTFKIGVSGINNFLNGNGSLSLDGNFLFDLSGASSGTTDSWTIIGSSLLANTAFGADFSISGFSDNNGVWTNGLYEFDQSTGILSVIPEPATWLLFSVGIVLLVVIKHRRKTGFETK